MTLKTLVPAALPLAALLLAPSEAAADCKVAKMLDLPVVMAGRRPLVTAQIGGRDARFVVDSGAFYSTLSRASAAEFGLKITPLPSSFRLKGVNGETSASSAIAPSLALGGVTIPKVSFIVGGTDSGTAGLLGQNILGLADVEYDLPHGMVRLMKTSDCGKTGLAYWAAGKPVTALKLERPVSDRFKPHTVATVTLNGRAIRATFDSGASSSVLTLAAAKRLGLAPGSPGMVVRGLGGGIGTRSVRTWSAAFDSLAIGDETIPKPRLDIADIDIGDSDMLIGIDFFLSHRLFVSNATRTLYMTYEGGPVFGIAPKGARTTDGVAVDLTDKTAAPTDAEGYSRRGAVFASTNRPKEALADFDKAVAMAPTEGRYVRQRAVARLANRQLLQGLADLDRAIALVPTDSEAHILRSTVRMSGGDIDGAKADLEAANATLAPSSNSRFTLGALYDRVDMPEAALANYDLWLRDHPEDVRRPNALNGRCWARGQLNRDLDKALSDCNAALKAFPARANFLDSRGLVRLRRGEFDAALADYDAALKASPRNAWTLYARGIAAARAGRSSEALANRAAALAINTRVAERARRIGLE
jgi:predicted aspartyl protease/Flp pilus assembly protein TadD